MSLDHAPQLARLGVKVQLPKAYNGAADSDVFENWLRQLLDWFSVYNLHVDNMAMDNAQLKLLSQVLEAKALMVFRIRE